MGALPIEQPVEFWIPIQVHGVVWASWVGVGHGDWESTSTTSGLWGLECGKNAYRSPVATSSFNS